MVSIRVEIAIDATVAEIWDIVEEVGRHVDWMEDAVAIRFTSATVQGAGTTFDCDTKIGPIRLTDKMEITDWVPERSMGVRHVGIVTGTGHFALTPSSDGRSTTFSWTEHLAFPWWLAGPVGAVVGAPVLKSIWRKNLRNLKQIVEAPVAP